MPWFATLVAVNLQTAFMTPPFGATLFYMKGTVPPGITMSDIYKGMYPFVVLQVVGLGLVHVLSGHRALVAENCRTARLMSHRRRRRR